MPLHETERLHPSKLRLAILAPLAAAALVACGGGGGGGNSSDNGNGSGQTADACPETGIYACKGGETEPLYTFQWALNYAKSWFTDNADAGAYGGGIDLNVEPVHQKGIKGQGVNVLVIDTGVDLANEDLAPNADKSLSWNFLTNGDDPSPLLTPEPEAHGTMAAGIIGAAQNGKGIMGIAPQAKLGGVPLIGISGVSDADFLAAYAGAPWSKKAHVINASYGGDTQADEYSPANTGLASLRAMKRERDGKGIVFIKAAGNAFDVNDTTGKSSYRGCGPLANMLACFNPGNDTEALEPNAIVTAALNAKGQAASYSSAGSVVWVTGMGGEYGGKGRYGESSGLTSEAIAAGKTADGPTIFSTDISSCTEGYSQTSALTDFMRGVSELITGKKDNPNCDYAYMNGTSSAAPTISGVVALMLSANPSLTWRDVRDILRLSARAVDQGYEKRTRNDISGSLSQPYNALFDLKTNTFTQQSGGAAQLVDGTSLVPVELGWQKNAAGNLHSNWYGFGVPDAAKAVELALLYKKESARSKSAIQTLPEFSYVTELHSIPYQKVTQIATFKGDDQTVDEFQLRLNGRDMCLGSLGLMVESPSGTKSLLKMPLDHFAFWDAAVAQDQKRAPVLSQSNFTDYGAGSYAFYGENAKGDWKIYAVMSNPKLDSSKWFGAEASCEAQDPANTAPLDPGLQVEARVIAQ